jgi:hypothetical protein
LTGEEQDIQTPMMADSAGRLFNGLRRIDIQETVPYEQAPECHLHRQVPVIEDSINLHLRLSRHSTT